MDLNLHHPPHVLPPDEKKAREALNRTRAWATCWMWDRVFGSFTGKDPLELGVDVMKLRGEEWFRSSQWNIAGSDVMVSAMIAVLKSMYSNRARIYTDPSAHMGLNLVSRPDVPSGADADGDGSDKTSASSASGLMTRSRPSRSRGLGISASTSRTTP
jgi:hypothetical protein